MNDLFGPSTENLNAVDWQPTREAGLARMRAFIPNAGRAYAANRNFDLGSDDRSNVSALSPWLRHRLISEWEVLSAILSAHGYNAAEKFIQEVFWRGYFKGWFQHRPNVWRRYRDDVATLSDKLNNDSDLSERYTRAISGQTGIKPFDHWAQELSATGYLHNHARMWFASMWIYTLELPWQLGADFFAQHLLDWDPASNTLSWRWVCGLHTVGKTYLARPDNIALYTNGRFDPSGQLAMEAPALLEAPLSAPIELPTYSNKPNISAPCILLITEEDTYFDPTDYAQTKITGVIALSHSAARSPHPISSRAQGFISEGLADRATRARQVFSDVPIITQDTENWGSALSDFTSTCDTKNVLVLEPPIGPAHDALSNAADALNTSGIALHTYQRRYDQLVWPHTKKGFFGLKKQVPTILSKLGLND